jgi:hypothetical protein
MRQQSAGLERVGEQVVVVGVREVDEEDGDQHAAGDEDAQGGMLPAARAGHEVVAEQRPEQSRPVPARAHRLCLL